MIYGINFNGSQIPPHIKRWFAARVKVRPLFRRRGVTPEAPKGGRKVHWLWASLAGVGQTEAERNTMLIVADNGHRGLWVETRKIKGAMWYGVYVYPVR